MTIIPGKVIRKDKNWIDTGDGTLFSTSSGATALIHNTETGQMHRISFVDQSPVTESNGLVSFADHHLFTEFVYPKGGYTEGGYPDGREGQKSIIGKVLNTDDNWTHFGASDTLLADEHGAEALIYDEVNHATHKIRFNKGSFISNATKEIVSFTESDVVDKIITPVAEIGELL